MPTLRELTAESIGRITRRGLESQIAQVEGALEPRELVVAVAPGHAAAAGMLIVLTGDRLILSTAEPFAQPTMDSIARGSITQATASSEGDAWTLGVEHQLGQIIVPGMFDRDAQRIATLLA